jgi:hypothetical protein
VNPIRFKSGRYKKYNCPICTRPCNVVRGKIRPEIRSWAGAMFWESVPKVYDEFSCKFENESWHKQIEAMREEIEKTASPSLKELIRKDINYILNSTKQG